MKNHAVRATLVFVATLIMIAAFVYYLYTNSDQYLELLNVSFAGIIALSLLALSFSVLSGIQNTILYRGLAVTNFSYLDGFFISATSSLANQLPIPGGIISKAYYLKRKYKISYLLFSSSTLALFFCYIALNGLIGLTVLVYWAVFRHVAVSLILVIGFSLMVASILVFWVPLKRIKVPVRLQEPIARALDGWLHISKNLPMTFKIIALQFVMIILLSIRYWLAFRMLSQEVSIGQLLLMSTASILTQVVSIAPGGLGVREGIVGGIAALLGFDVGVSVVAVGLDRLVSTFVKFLAGGISTVILGGQLAEMATEVQTENGK